MENNAVITNSSAVLNSDQLLKHWQGHRSLTRKIIDKFPEKELFSYSIGGMRPFAKQVMEIIDLTGPGVQGIVTGEWEKMDELPHHTGEGMPQTKAELLQLWDEITEALNSLWPEITPEKFNGPIKAFGMYDGTGYSSIQYYIDNEIHHRAQGYVYLRSLGIEPTPFWERY